VEETQQHPTSCHPSRRPRYPKSTNKQVKSNPTEELLHLVTSRNKTKPFLMTRSCPFAPRKLKQNKKALPSNHPSLRAKFNPLSKCLEISTNLMTHSSWLITYWQKLSRFLTITKLSS